MKRKITAGLVTCLAVSALLSGCSKPEKSLDTTSVFVRKDGTVKAALYESFDTSVYSSDELTAFIEDSVSAYNLAAVGEAFASSEDTKTPLAISLTSIEYKANNAILLMEYASCDDYMEFNAAEGAITQFATGTVAGAKEAGIDLSKFTVTDGTNQKAASEMEDEAYIVFCQGTETISVDGTISFTTADVTKTADDTAEIASEDSVSLIVFK